MIAAILAGAGALLVGAAVFGGTTLFTAVAWALLPLGFVLGATRPWRTRGTRSAEHTPPTDQRTP